jgi:hypothetical protein
MKKLIAILFLSITCVQAIELGTKSYTILIDIPKLEEEGWTLATIKNKGLKLIEEAGGQPFRLTHHFRAPNTNYFLIWVVPKTQTEVDYFKSAKNKGIAKIISSGDVVTKQTRFGNIQVWEKIKINDLPEDFHVVESTP